MKKFLILGLIPLLLIVPSEVFALEIETDGTQYRITQYENDHLYGWQLTFDGEVSSTGTLRLDDTNTNKWYPVRTDDRTGNLVWTWYYDTARTQPLTSISYFVESEPEPIIHPNSPCIDGCEIQGNNAGLKIFASGYVENPIDGVNTISSVWKDPDGVIVYDEILQVNSQGQFNNEFDNPMYVGDMRDTGKYTTTYTYHDVVSEYQWSYASYIYEPEPESNTSNSTSTTTSSPNSTSTTTQSSSSSDDDDEPVNQIITSFVLDGHEMSIVVKDYVGTSKFVTFTGENFTTSETIDIEVTDTGDGHIVDIQTSVNGAGYFSVPAIVETSTLGDDNFLVQLTSPLTDITFEISWTGTEFAFEGVHSSTDSTSSSTSTDSTSSSTSTDSTSSSTSSSGTTDWNQFILDLSVEDRLELIRAVFSYVLG